MVPGPRTQNQPKPNRARPDWNTGSTGVADVLRLMLLTSTPHYISRAIQGTQGTGTRGGSGRGFSKALFVVVVDLLLCCWCWPCSLALARSLPRSASRGPGPARPHESVVVVSAQRWPLAQACPRVWARPMLIDLTDWAGRGDLHSSCGQGRRPGAGRRICGCTYLTIPQRHRNTQTHAVCFLFCPPPLPPPRATWGFALFVFKLAMPDSPSEEGSRNEGRD